MSIACVLRTCAVSLFCFSMLVSAAAAPIAGTTPRVLKFSASLSPDPAAQFEPGIVGITFAIYKERDDEAPLWMGTQNVTIDAQGRFTVLLGDADDNPIPLDLFSSGQARWMGMQRMAERESERIMLVSVPYALKAADAETLGGKPMSAFVLAPTSDGAAKGTLTPVVNGAAGYIAKFIDTTNIDNSVLYESAGKIGLNTTSPQGPLHINSVLTYRSGGVGSVQTGTNPGIMLENPSTNSTVLLSESFGFTVFASLSATAPLSGSDLRFVVRPTGNVGIATNNPQAPLHIGATRLYRSLNVAAVQTGTNPGLMLENPATNSTVALTENNGLSIYTKPSSTLPFTGSDLKMALTIGGNLGIGTGAPAEKLDVAGNVKLSGNLALPGTLGGVGIITVGGTTWFHNTNENTFFGPNAGTFTTTGSGNQGIGVNTLGSITTGNGNTASGVNAIFNNTTGNYNVATGLNALLQNTTGTTNTAYGTSALQQNTTGSANIAVGGGQNLTTGDNNIDIGHPGAAAEANTTRVGSAQTRFFAAGIRNVATGVADGQGVLIDSSGQLGTIGDVSFSNNLALPSTASGGTAGVITMGGIRFAHSYLTNTFVGLSAGNFTMSAGQALGNTAVGKSALASTTSGDSSTAVGAFALQNATFGNNNTAVGFGALFNDVTGSNNTAVGSNALAQTTGASNVAMGSGAGSALTTGSNNIDIGHTGFAGESSTIRIGTAAQTRTFIAGIFGVTTGSPAVAAMIDSNGQLGTSSSSRRYKFDIADMADATERLAQLRPVTFRYLAHGNNAPLQYGLIAEEVAKVYPDMVIRGRDGQPETVMYQFLAPMLLNAVQKQQQQIEEQRTTISTLTSTIDSLGQRLQALETQLARKE